MPKPKKEDDDELDEEKNLLEKLIVYKKIKGVSAFFKDKYINSGEVYAKRPEVIEEIREKTTSEDLLRNLNLLDLYNIYNNQLEIYNNKQNKANVIQKKIYVDKYKIEDKLEYIKDRMENYNINNFSDLVQNCECKLECVVTFLALLEMIKQKMVKVYQSENFREIYIERRINEDEQQ